MTTFNCNSLSEQTSLLGWQKKRKRKRKRKSYALRIHPRRELRKAVSLAKKKHRYPQPDSNWGPLRTSPPSRSLASCSGLKWQSLLRLSLLFIAHPSNGPAINTVWSLASKSLGHESNCRFLGVRWHWNQTRYATDWKVQEIISWSGSLVGT